jgi:hypothetical protein
MLKALANEPIRVGLVNRDGVDDDSGVIWMRVALLAK